MAKQTRESGIRVNCICPGAIVTPIFGKGLGMTPEQADQTLVFMKGVFTKRQPIQCAGMPSDIAQAALWLASDAAGFVTGLALLVDGGLTTGRLWSERLAEAARALTPGPSPIAMGEGS